MSANFTPDFKPNHRDKPFRFWCQSVLPLVYDDSLSYYELLCKVVAYLNHCIADLNKMGKDVNGLYGAYVKLQDYVNNYFDNLDVQEEINKKLDEMAENGQLEQVIEQFLKFNTFRVFETFAKMVESKGLYNGEYVSVLGHYTADDGGACSYLITDSQTDFTVATATEGLYAHPVITTNEVNAVVFGLAAEVEDNTPNLSAAVKYCKKYNKNLTIPNGNFKFDDKIDFVNFSSFVLNIFANCYFKSKDAYKACFNFIDCDNILINNKGKIYSEHLGLSTPPSGHQRPKNGNLSSNRTAVHISRCHGITVDGGTYTGLEYVSQCTVDIQDTATPNIRDGRSTNIVYTNMVVTDTYQPFLASFAENVSYNYINITMRDGCGDGDHPFYVSRFAKGFNFNNCDVDMTTNYPLNVFKLSSAFEGADSLDVAHISNINVKNLGAGFIALEDNTIAYINNCYTEFSAKAMPTDLTINAYKTPYIYFVQHNTTIYDTNSIYINTRRDTDGNYLQHMSLSANTNAKYYLDNCTYKGLQEIVSGSLLTDESRVPNYEITNCNLQLSKWLTWLNVADEVGKKCYFYLSDNNITCEFKSTLVTARGDAYIYLVNNYINNVGSAGGLIAATNSVVTDSNFKIVNNIFDNVSKIVDDNLRGNSVIDNNYLIKLNKLVDPVTTYNNFYVDSINGDDNNSGNADYPFATLDKALTKCHNNVIDNRIVILDNAAQTIKNLQNLNNKSLRLVYNSGGVLSVNIDYNAAFKITNLALQCENIAFSNSNVLSCQLQNCTLNLTNCQIPKLILTCYNSYITANSTTFNRLVLNNSTLASANSTFVNAADTDTITATYNSNVSLTGTCSVGALDAEGVSGSFINCGSATTLYLPATITTSTNKPYYGLKCDSCTIWVSNDKYIQYHSTADGGKFGNGGRSITNTLIVHYNAEFNTPG